MAATVLATNRTSRSSLLLNNIVMTQSDVVNGNSFANDGRMWLVLNNASATPGSAPVTVTIKATGITDFDLPLPDRVYTLQPGAIIAAGPFIRELFNQPDGTVLFTTSAAIVVCALTDSQE